MFCKNCGKETDDNAVKCTQCGAEMKSDAPVSYTIDSEVSPKSKVTTILLCIFLGSLGVHRFYVGKTGTGVLMLLTMGCCGIMTLVDLVMIVSGSFTDSDGKIISK